MEQHVKIANAFNWTIKYLNKMPIGTSVKVKDVPVNDKDLFVEMVKCHIDVFNDVEFNADYSRIYKIGILDIKK